MYDVAIIGAGVAGTFIARQLSAYKIKVLLLDKENDVGNKTSAANSAIIHAGYDARSDQLKGRFNALGNTMFTKVCEDLDVLFERCGSLVIGFNEEDEKTIKDLYENGIRNGIKDMEIIYGNRIFELEPNLNPDVTVALYAKTAGIIAPFELTAALAENAVDNGVDLSLETDVLDIKTFDKHYELITNKGSFKTEYIINCAGVYADKISNMVADEYFKIRPRKGHYYVMDLSEVDLIKHVIFQCPSKKGKGVLVTPSIHGNILVGPDSEFIDEKFNNATDAERLSYVRKQASKTCKKIDFSKVIRVFAGLRATGNTGDFIIEHVKGTRGLINVAGFESPGLSSVPAVADHVVKILDKLIGGMEENESFNPKRRKVIRFNMLSDEEKSRVIAENPTYAKVICRCETITEAEIVDSIHRSAGARTVKAIKKRVRPGAGRCQGGFCLPRVQEILARELGKDMTEIPYDSTEAYVLTESMAERGKK